MDCDNLTQDIHVRTKCLYCEKPIPKDKHWESKFEHDFHYKTTTCDCGKEIWLKMHFCGSGHDNWDGNQKKKTIDSKIKEIENPMAAHH